MVRTGPLPIQGKADLTFDETVFSMMADNLMQKKTIEVIFSYPNLSNESKKKVRIALTEVVKPGSVADITRDINHKLLEEIIGKYNMNGTLNLAFDYFYDELIFKRSWLLFGHLETRPHLVLCIVYSPTVGCGSYAFKQTNPVMN